MIHKIIIGLCVALLLPWTLAFADDHKRLPEELLSIYTDLNEMCRGESGDDPHTNEACDVRAKVSALLWKEGYCFGKHGQYGGEAGGTSTPRTRIILVRNGSDTISSRFFDCSLPIRLIANHAVG
jgi:hypothetical protein